MGSSDWQEQESRLVVAGPAIGAAASVATPTAPASVPDARRDLATSASVWLQACRWKSLFISGIAVLVGGAVAAHEGAWSWRLVLALIGSVLIQAGTNLMNVSYNYKAGAARHAADPRGSSAPVRSGRLTPPQVRRASVLCFALGSACGLALVRLCGPEILLLGIPSVAAGWFYAAPPIRLAYLALGALTVFVFMGPVMVMGAYFVVTLHWSAAAAYASVAVGLLAAGIMHTNDVRDYDSDVANGKRTLATLMGRQAASWTLLLLDAAAYVAVIAGVLASALPFTVLIVLLSLPTAVAQVRLAFRERDPRVLNEVWFRGVRLHTQFGVMLIVGVMVGRVGLS